mgnify:CR=1 FL=1
MCQYLIYLNVQVKIRKSRKKEFTAQIEQFTRTDLKLIKSNWKFNWKELYESKAKFYRVN